MSVILTILVLIFTIIETTLFALPLALTALIIWSTRHSTSSILIIAALSGGLLDILTLRPYGLTTLIFLLTVFIIQRYSLKVETYRLRYLIPVTILATGAYSYYFYNSWITQVLVSLLVIIIFILIYRKSGSKYDTLIP